MAACALYCLVISVLGVIFLTILGLALHADYPYIKAEDRVDHSWGCFYGAITYICTGIACTIWLICANKKSKKVDDAQGADADIQMAERVANPSLDDDPNASLLKNA